MQINTEVMFAQIQTARGVFGALLTSTGLARLTFPGEVLDSRWWELRFANAKRVSENPHFAVVTRQLTAYFEGTLQCFDLPVHLLGTPFQQQVWQALQDIPHGEVRTYGQIAIAIGAPTAARAVGAASGANPVPIVVPCHRVIGSNGQLTGYAGGVSLKRQLLSLEQAGRKQLLASHSACERTEVAVVSSNRFLLPAPGVL